MKLLLVAATHAEIKPLMDCFSLEEGNNAMPYPITVLITQVGMVPTAFMMGRVLANFNFDLAINAGIAGSFDRHLKIGEVISVTQDCFAELGAEDDGHFLTMNDLGLGQNVFIPLKPDIPSEKYKEVKGITVNKVHGREDTINATIRQWQPQVETMEGAAFVYACNQAGLPSLQIRAISNYIEKRNRNNWNVALAIKNLNKTLVHLLNGLK